MEMGLERVETWMVASIRKKKKGKRIEKSEVCQSCRGQQTEIDKRDRKKTDRVIDSGENEFAAVDRSIITRLEAEKEMSLFRVKARTMKTHGDSVATMGSKLR